MMKNIPHILLLISITSVSVAQVNIDFTSGQGFSDGDLVGQNSWTKVFGTDYVFDVDSTSGVATQNDTGGAIRRNFTTLEMGTAFDPNLTIVSYDIVLDVGSVTGGVFGGFAIGIGGAGHFADANTDIGVNIRGDGYIQVFDDNATSYILGGFVPMSTTSPVTISMTIDYGNDTYTISRSDTGATETDRAFNQPTIDGGYEFRIDSNINVDIGITSITAGAIVPEPSTYSLLLGFLAITQVLLRRR